MQFQFCILTASKNGVDKSEVMAKEFSSFAGTKMQLESGRSVTGSLEQAPPVTMSLQEGFIDGGQIEGHTF